MNKVKRLLPFCALLFLLACKEEKKQDPVVEPKSKAEVPVLNPQEMEVNAFAPVDVSPMDMSYFPVDYTKIKMANGKVSSPVMRVVYSRPHLMRRRLFDGILRYNEPWRLGANESTEIEFFRNVTIQDKKIKAGRYIIYCVPHEKTWTIILNSNIDTWGLKQDSAKDVARFEVPSSLNNARLEYFTMIFEKTGTGADLLMGWDDVLVRLPIVF